MPELFDSSVANLLVFLAIVAAAAAIGALLVAVVFAWRDNHPKHTRRRGMAVDKTEAPETVSG